MSVESCTSVAPKATTGTESHGAKGKSRITGKDATADAGGFSALLTMLGDGDVDVSTTDLGDMATGDTATGDASDSGGKGATKHDLLTTNMKPGGENVAVDPHLLLAQSLQVQPRQAAPDVQAVATLDGKAMAPDVVRAGLDAKQAKPEGALPSATTAGAKGTEIHFAELGEAQKPPVSNKSSAQTRGAARVAVSDLTQQPSTTAATKALAAEAHMQKQLQSEPRTEITPAQLQALATSGGNDQETRRAERLGEKDGSTRQGQGGDGSWGSSLVSATSSAEPSFTMDVASAQSQAAPMSPEAMVAEQVSYWVGRDVQNAELKLDGLGESPVKVSISMQGNEARVEFRTDQLQARQVLEGSVSYLRDLLGNEGLVLSGVSVGASGAGANGSSGAGEQQGRKGAGRQAMVAVQGAGVAERNVRTTATSGRAVDLFV